VKVKRMATTMMKAYATMILLVLIGSLKAQDKIAPNGTSTWTSACDTAETERGFDVCCCAQRDQANDQLQMTFNSALIVLNKEIAALRFGAPLDSNAVSEVEDLTKDLIRSQEAWLAYRDGNSSLVDALSPRHTGAGCAVQVSLTHARIIELEEVLELLRDRY
jgi:uncharacterized protein YecT (DUF1311 family)